MRNSYYIKADKWAEFRRLHLTRFRYEFDEKNNRYFRKFRRAKTRNTIFIDGETRHIYVENCLRKRLDVAQTEIVKLLNRDMVEVREVI